MYQIPGHARRVSRGAPQQDDMSQILAMYQMFSPEQQAREELIRAQAAQTQQETAFSQRTMDPRIEAMQRQAQHDQIIQQQLQMQMQQAQAMGPEQLRALQLQNDYLAKGGAHGAKDAAMELQQAGQIAQIAQLGQAQQYAMGQSLTDPEQRKQLAQAAPLSQMSPQDYLESMKHIGPYGPGKDTYTGEIPPHPVEVGRYISQLYAQHPGMDTVPLNQKQLDAHEVYKAYMGMPKEWDTDPYWLQQAQAAQSIEALQKLKEKWWSYNNPAAQMSTDAPDYAF